MDNLYNRYELTSRFQFVDNNDMRKDPSLFFFLFFLILHKYNNYNTYRK